MRTNEKTTLYNFLSDSNKIIIPDIQRDYVLGSGKGKLSSLFKAMIEKAGESKEFEFSCILAYRDPENNVYIYDGQQRIVTLIYLCAKLNESENRNDIENLLQKFEFKGRESANEWLRNPSKIHKQEAVDFTTFSIAKLRENFGEPIKLKVYNYAPEEKITLDFLLHKVKFDLIFIDRISDAEQFFKDVNDGLELKDYEIYKAELYHNTKAILGAQKFKEFALKMENRWLEFFLEQRTFRKSNKEELVSEEEELVFFIKFCLRMMWVEEKKSLEEYKENNFNWLEEKHFTRIEHILDSVIMYMSKEGDNRNKYLSCISYSCSSLSRGEHWNIIDENYTEMLTIFIQNLWNTEQNCKDVVMWCFLSNLPYTKDGTNNSDLYKYLHFIKKILNVNRGCNENATMVYGNYIEKHRVHFALYYVKKIPKYYLNINSTNDNNEKENGISDYLSSIIVANGKIELSTDKCYAEYFIENCKNEKLKKVLDNEILKYKSVYKETIQGYENLAFINGLVDNFLEYSSSDCDLKDWAKKLSPEKIFKIVSCDKEDQYIGILKFMRDELVYSEKISIDNIKICWSDYQHKYVGYEEGSIVFHTWCDFFTQESVLKIQNDLDLKYKYLLDLPDGWIARDKLDQREKLYQIAETRAKVGGFSAENPVYANRVKKLFDLSSFWTNFHEVRITEGKKYIINGKEETQLPGFLASYNNEKWVDNRLSTIYSIYYYPYDPYDFYFSNNYLNQVLLKMFQRNQGCSSGEFEEYIKNNFNKLQYVEIDGKRYFIKLVKII